MWHAWLRAGTSRLSGGLLLSLILPPPACFSCLQELFPGSDVARMVELAPAAFLEGRWPPKQQQLEAASTLLRGELEGAEVDFMFQVRSEREREGGKGRGLVMVARGRVQRVRLQHCAPAHYTLTHPPQEDPLILFEPLESLRVGLRRMRELWPGLTPAALANSEPLHLSLAVKALGLTGPPKGF